MNQSLNRSGIRTHKVHEDSHVLFDPKTSQSHE